MTLMDKNTESRENRHASTKKNYLTITFGGTNNNGKNKIVLTFHRDVVPGDEKMEQINYRLYIRLVTLKNLKL